MEYQSIGITGLVVLGGNTSVQNPTANFHNAFEGTTNSGYGVTNALVKIIFSYAGYYNAFNVVNEVKVCARSLQPRHADVLILTSCRTQSRQSEPMHSSPCFSSLFCTNSPTLPTLPLVSSTLANAVFNIANTDYRLTVSKSELLQSKQIAGSLFFQKVFGSSGAVRGLNFLIALSAFGNLIAVLLGQSRIIRECGR